MKAYHKLATIVSSVALAVTACAGLAHAQNEAGSRLSEESIVTQDPTVANRGKFMLGVGADAWYVYEPWQRTFAATAQSDEKVWSGSSSAFIGGGSFYAGYDDLTLMFSAKTGPVNRKVSGTWPVSNAPGTYKEKLDETEFEIGLRYLFRDKKVLGIHPYILAGYNYITLTGTESYTWRGREFGYSSTETWNVPYIGIGGILPLGSEGRFGLRGDMSASYSWESYRSDRNYKQNGSGPGFVAHLTGYVNIFEGFSLQVGTKALYLNGEGGQTTSDGRVGAFAQIGYKYRF